MSSIITDWINRELYPALYKKIDTALPDLKFEEGGSKWRSKLNRDGSEPRNKRRDKTVITEKAPGIITENGERGSISIIDYIIENKRLDFIQAVNYLADVVNLTPPNDPKFDPEKYRKSKERTTLLEDANSYFIYCMENSPGADEVKQYLNSRGYSPEDIKAMELGYIPRQDKLYKYLSDKKHLSDKKYSPETIKESLELNTGIGSTHRLTIPYRSGGTIKGFKFRRLTEDAPKYLNSTGLDRIGGFFNLSGLKGDKDLVIVEGELDSLHATVKGVENVVATGGSTVNPEQIRDALKNRAKKFTICMDREPGKEEETINRVNRIIEVILGEGVSLIYVVELLDLGGGKTDPDRLIKESGVENFKTAIAQALPYYEYWLQTILRKYSKVEEERELQPKDIDSLLQDVVERATRIKEPIDKDRYKKLFTSLDGIKELGITEESYQATVDKLQYSRDKEAQDKTFKNLLSEATALQDKGETDKALELLDKQSKQIRAITGKGLLPPVLSFTALLDEIAETPYSLKTGYSSLDFIGFTPGAISLIAGRPSHGKTTLLFNLLLRMSELYQDKRFYFFTYEEPLRNLSIKLINNLTATNLSGYYGDYPDLSKRTNYEFIKAYIKTGRRDIPEIQEANRRLRELIDSRRITVIDRNYSVEELYSLLTYLNKEEQIGGVFIDYIQRMRTDRKTQDKRTEIAHISDQVLQIAKDTSLPIILGAQLNRATDTKGKPKLENLKEAGNLEEDANTVISVYNESREQDETEDGEKYSKINPVDLEIKALKNREGGVNQKALLTFDKWTGVITDKAIKENPFK